MAKFKKIKSLSEGYRLGLTDERYSKLMIAGAENLGHCPKNLDEAYNALRMEAMETDEEGVVGEVNFCMDLV